MFIRFYGPGCEVGKWRGWIEDTYGNALGYFDDEGKVLWMGGVQRAKR